MLIHISGAFYEHLTSHHQGFITELRGQVEIKVWLICLSPFYNNQPNAPGQRHDDYLLAAHETRTPDSAVYRQQRTSLRCRTLRKNEHCHWRGVFALWKRAERHSLLIDSLEVLFSVRFQSTLMLP